MPCRQVSWVGQQIMHMGFGAATICERVSVPTSDYADRIDEWSGRGWCGRSIQQPAHWAWRSLICRRLISDKGPVKRCVGRFVTPQGGAETQPIVCHVPDKRGNGGGSEREFSGKVVADIGLTEGLHVRSARSLR